MIKSENTKVVISGGSLEIMQDFANIVESVRQVLTDKYGSDKADDLISTLGMFAYANGDDEKSMYADRCFEIMIGKENVTNS